MKNSRNIILKNANQNSVNKLQQSTKLELCVNFMAVTLVGIRDTVSSQQLPSQEAICQKLTILSYHRKQYSSLGLMVAELVLMTDFTAMTICNIMRNMGLLLMNMPFQETVDTTKIYISYGRVKSVGAIPFYI